MSWPGWSRPSTPGHREDSRRKGAFGSCSHISARRRVDGRDKRGHDAVRGWRRRRLPERWGAAPSARRRRDDAIRVREKPAVEDTSLRCGQRRPGASRTARAPLSARFQRRHGHAIGRAVAPPQ
ncbi:Hypothetical protein BN69_2751 [Methylocystis sp. SC2]|nr:Hypothetical protein BN69_2751 [Methylocystis sp. SC2]